MFNNLNFKLLIEKGDQKIFRQLMELTSDNLLWFALRFIKNKEIAEEIVSDVYVKLWNNRAQIGSIINLKSYLFICVRNGCLSHLRSTKNEKLIPFENVSELNYVVIDNQEDSAIEQENLEQIYAAIETLPDKCKQVFTLAKINGLKYREIAEILGISEKTVNNHLVLAVRRIMEHLNISKKNKNKNSPFKRAGLLIVIM